MRLVRPFARNEDGNITILFAFTLVLLLLFTGGAVDFARRNSVRADLIESLDAAGLAIARLDEANPPELAALSGAQREAYLKDYGERFFYENFKYENLVEGLAVDFDITPQVVRPAAEGEIKTLFLGAANAARNGATTVYDYLSMSTDTEITRRGSGPIELALVLDVTGSMDDRIGGVKKIKSLRDASDALLDVLYGDDPNATSDYVTTSVVPFNAYVNAGGAVDKDGDEVWNSAWSDANAEAVYHGARFFHVTGAGAVDLNTRVNHFRLFESTRLTDWKGCLEERPYPLDELDVSAGAAGFSSQISGFRTAPAGATNAKSLAAFTNAPALSLSTSELGRTANTRFVPMFAPDEADCNNTGGNGDCNWGTSNRTLSGVTYTGAWFDDPENDGSGHDNDHYNNSWVDDRQYTNDGRAQFPKYLPVVNYARRVMRHHHGGSASSCPTSPSTTQSDDAFNAWLTAYRATECAEDEYALRQGYVGRWNASTSTYEGKFDLSTGISIDEAIDENGGDQSTRGPNRGCSAPILIGSDEKRAVRNHIQGLAPSGNTNSAEGMMWGWRILSPGAPFESDIPYNDNQWQKAVVLMTDGFNTVSDRDTHLDSDLTAYGYAREARMGSGVDSASEMKAELDKKLLRICERMKANGILIYAITFGLSDADADERATKETFQACATRSEAPYYFDAPSGDDLEDAFKDIASDLVQLHVSR